MWVLSFFDSSAFCCMHRSCWLGLQGNLMNQPHWKTWCNLMQLRAGLQCKISPWILQGSCQRVRQRVVEAGRGKSVDWDFIATSSGASFFAANPAHCKVYQEVQRSNQRRWQCQSKDWQMTCFSTQRQSFRWSHWQQDSGLQSPTQSMQNCAVAASLYLNLPELELQD